MRLTTRGRYAVTAMLDLTLHAQDKPISLADISPRDSLFLCPTSSSYFPACVSPVWFPVSVVPVVVIIWGVPARVFLWRRLLMRSMNP